MSELPAGRWAALRQRAERLAGTSRTDIARMPPQDIQALAYELQLHQAELEIQNDDLCQTQSQLAAAHDRYRDLFERAPVGYLTHDAQGVIREANLTAAGLLGVERGMLIDTRLSDLIVRDDQDIWFLHRRRLMETREGQTSEIRFARPGAGIIYLQLDSVALPPGDSAAEYRTSLIDCTARRRAEVALQRAHDELEAQVVARTAGLAAARERLQEEINERTMVEQREKQLLADLAHVARMHTLGEMASSLAHELNQPLGAMLAEADAARQRLRQEHEFDGTQLQASLQFIAEQALRGGQLVRRIRQFAKRAGPERTPISLTEVLGEILPLIKKDLREAGIVLSIEAPADLPRALADKTQVQQVILNLVRNAVEAMESTPEDARELTIRAAAGSQELEVAVGDTGCGLPVEQVEHPEKLFDSFVTTKKDGLGLGLAISRSILESHGGSLSARQNPGRGATFTFTLPLSSEGS